MQSPKIVAKALLISNEGCGLLLTRSNTSSNRPNQADLPGGNIDAGESWEEGVAREIREETGLKVLPEDLMLIRVHTAMKGSENIIRPFYATTMYKGEIELSHEHSAYEWVNLSDMPSRFVSPGWGDSVDYALENNLI